MKVTFIGDCLGKVHYNRYLEFSRNIGMEFKFVVKGANLQKKCAASDAVYYASFTMFRRNPVQHPRIFGSATSWKCIIGDAAGEDIKLLQKFRGISANNKALASQLRKYRKDIEYIPNGVDSDFFSPDQNYVHTPGQIRVGWVGNANRKEKNFALFQEIKKNVPAGIRFQSVITKKSSDPRKMRDRSKMLEYYRKLDYLLVTSSYEGTPNPALEAASCGVPIISTRVGNMPELIKEGVSGFFVEVDKRDLRKRLNMILSLPAETYSAMRQTIRHTIVSEWKWDTSCRKFENFLRK